MTTTDENGMPRAAGVGSTLPAVSLPPKVPQARYRPAQSNMPDDRATRDRLKQLAAEEVASLGLVPPMSMVELRERAAVLRGRARIDPAFDEFIAVLINNAAWSDTLAQIPYERRLLLLPKCLRVEEHCPAPFDEFGLLCKECGLCSIQDLTVEADRLGYAVLVAEGSAIVRQMIETGRIEAVVGVSCLNVLEKSFPHMEAAAVPGVAIPLLQDDCINCTVDIDWVWDVIHLTAEDRTYRLDLEGLKDEVRGWFTPGGLDEVMGEAADPTAEIARGWLARSGKRWRPYLAVCVHLACTDSDLQPDADLRKLAVAIECFHKASLIHDDIEDGDAERYGEPTLHVEHGEAVAINAGDFLIGEGYRLISEVGAPAETRVAMLRAAAEGHVTLCRGQGAELVWARSPEPLTSMEVLQIFRQKTSPAFDVALRLGALYAGAGDDVHEVLGKYSEALGIAYQIRDDLDDIAGDAGANGHAAFRPSVLLAAARERAKNGDREWLDQLWSGAALDAEAAARARKLAATSGAVDHCTMLLETYKETAIRSLADLENPNLKGLLRRVVGKVFNDLEIKGWCREFEVANGVREDGAEDAGETTSEPASATAAP